jgi:hypothetical protein
MKTSSRFSIMVFAPVLVAFLLPPMFLLPGGVLLVLIAMFDPTVPFSGAASYSIWVIGPVVTAFGIFLAGRWLHPFYMRAPSASVAWVVIWALFSAELFIAAWLGVAVLTSLGASETPLHIFLSTTALGAALLTLLAQLIAIPWLYAVSRSLRRHESSDRILARADKPSV